MARQAKDKVKNSRGVAINHLRKILKELDGIELVYEKGCFRFTLSSVFYCDYLRFMAIVAENCRELPARVPAYCRAWQVCRLYGRSVVRRF